MKLNDKQSFGLNEVAKGKNVFITGPGGVGKSVLIGEIKKHFGDNTVFLAPTGIAALNIGGQTIHSAFRLSFGVLKQSNWSNFNKKTAELFDVNGPVKRIVIDEISMVRADVLTTIDEQLKRIRRTKQPFGGLQVIIVGDFYQLSPVLTGHEKNEYFQNYDSPYCFVGTTWSAANLQVIDLDEIMRQSDQEFISHLMNVREKREDYKKSVDFFNTLSDKDRISRVLDEDPVILCTVNKTADSINLQNYNELDGEERIYHGTKTGHFPALPAEMELKLKYGAKVMITANSTEYKNGEIGYVVNMFNDSIELMMEADERKMFIKYHTWEDCEYVIVNGKLDKQVIGTYTQLPIKYAWAITIHKAQGQSLSHAIIDIGRGAFVHGQTYVALSRLRSLDGLALFSELHYSDVIVDKEVMEFYKNGCRGDRLF